MSLSSAGHVNPAFSGEPGLELVNVDLGEPSQDSRNAGKLGRNGYSDDDSNFVAVPLGVRNSPNNNLSSGRGYILRFAGVVCGTTLVG